MYKLLEPQKEKPPKINEPNKEDGQRLHFITKERDSIDLVRNATHVPPSSGLLFKGAPSFVFRRQLVESKEFVYDNLVRKRNAPNCGPTNHSTRVGTIGTMF